MQIRNIVWFNRPSYKLARGEKLSSTELLAVLLYRVKGRNVLSLANSLIRKYNLNGLSKFSYKQLLYLCNNDKEAALRLLAFFRLSKEFSKLSKGGFNVKVISSAKDVYDRFVDELSSYEKEVLKVVLLDTKNVVIADSCFGF